MNGAIEARGRAIAAEAVAGWRGRIAERLRDIGGIEVEQSDAGVVVSGRRLRARWIGDARLRWIGGWL